MKKIHAIGGILLFCGPQSVLAQDMDDLKYNLSFLIDDVNAIAYHLSKDDISNGDVIIVAAITCGTMRLSARALSFERIAERFKERYPSSDEAQSVDVGEYVEFEREVFRSLGATPQAIDLVTQVIEEHPTLPATAPDGLHDLSDEMETIAEVSCEIRAEPAAVLGPPGDEPERSVTLSETAAPEGASLADSMFKAVIGTASLVGNALVGGATAPETGGATLVLAAISVGWGWNRVEEAYFEILEFRNAR